MGCGRKIGAQECLWYNVPEVTLCRSSDRQQFRSRQFLYAVAAERRGSQTLRFLADSRSVLTAESRKTPGTGALIRESITLRRRDLPASRNGQNQSVIEIRRVAKTEAFSRKDYSLPSLGLSVRNVFVAVAMIGDCWRSITKTAEAEKNLVHILTLFSGPSSWVGEERRI